jgi:hypothetical protein
VLRWEGSGIPSSSLKGGFFMAKQLVVCAMAFLLAGTALGDDNDYTSKGGKFTVRFPGKVVEKNMSSAGLTAKGVGYEAKDGSYTVVYADLPDAAAAALKTPEAVETVLETLRDTAVEQLKGKLLDDKKIKLGGVAGMELKVALPDGKVMRNQLYLSGTRVYQVMIVGTKDFVAGNESDKFVKSFKISK